MTPKEKAEELFQKMYNKLKDTKAIFLEYKSDKNSAKQCALIAVDEILTWLKAHQYSTKNYDAFVFYNEVKQEIEKL
jgi:hypothetical protein